MTSASLSLLMYR